MDFITRVSLKRPVSTLLALLALVVFGVSSILTFEMELEPEVEMPMLAVSVEYKGADPETVDKLLAKPIEEYGMKLQGMSNVQTTSCEGRCFVMFTFQYGTDMDHVLNECKADMDELLPDMDVVALSLPGTDEVKGMFDERRLRLMKKSAILINVGRGNSVVTGDLLKVMAEGHLRAACLDVMDPEPLPEGHPLWTAERVYITPHISGGYRAGVNYEKVMNVALNNLSLVLQGKDPVHIVDRKLGY